MTRIALRHGIFLPPFHPMEENPTACLDRDLELMVWLDRLGFHEAWIGEHHSAGFEIISSPEIFIAIAAERTKFIRFGTGVISLPYPHRAARPSHARPRHVRCRTGSKTVTVPVARSI